MLHMRRLNLLVLKPIFLLKSQDFFFVNTTIFCSDNPSDMYHVRFERRGITDEVECL